MLYYKSISEIATLIRSREISAVELTQACLGRISATEERLAAFALIAPERALAAAAQADQEIATAGPRGPLQGVPVAVKDLCDWAGYPTSCGSRIQNERTATSDSGVVERLKAAGAVIVGKTHTHEYAYGVVTPPTRNPWNLEAIPGGSSGGSAAAVAAGEVFMGVGTDTGGSIRIPASICGVVGLKPSYGLVSRAGITPLSWSFDHAGPLARTVRDTAITLSALSGYDSRDAGSLNIPVLDYTQHLESGVSGLRLGVPSNFYFEHLEPAVESAVRAAISELESLGAEIKEVKLPLSEHFQAVYYGICMPEASSYHQTQLRAQNEDYGEDVRILLELGEMIPATEYIKALRVRRLIIREWQALFHDLDAVVAPTVPAAAPKQGLSKVTWSDGVQESFNEAYVRFSCPANLTGLPAITVPCGVSPEGLPVGVQFISGPLAETTLLQIAYAFEQSTEWHAAFPMP